MQSAIEQRFKQLQTSSGTRASLEANEQIAFFEWIEVHKAKYPELRWIHHIPNGEKRDKFTAARLKRMGVRAGVWDVFCPATTEESGLLGIGLYIEFKGPKGSLTKEQCEFRDALLPFYVFRVCKSWIEAVSCVVEFYELPVELIVK